jgi:hypothetical protein
VPGAIAEAGGDEKRFQEGFQHLFQGCMDHAVADVEDAEASGAGGVGGFGNMYPTGRLEPVALVLEVDGQLGQPSVGLGSDVGNGNAVGPWGIVSFGRADAVPSGCEVVAIDKYLGQIGHRAGTAARLLVDARLKIPE